jgi:hypothetical protein
MHALAALQLLLLALSGQYPARMPTALDNPEMLTLSDGLPDPVPPAVAHPIPLLPTAELLLEGEPTPAHDRAVQAALFSRAVGYTRRRQVLDRQGRAVEIEEEMPPDAAAAVKWLQARKPGEWGERRQEQLRVVIDRMGDGTERIAVGYGSGQAVEVSSGQGEGRVIEHDPNA